MRKPSVRTRKDDSQDEVDWQSEEEEEEEEEKEEEGWRAKQKLNMRTRQKPVIDFWIAQPPPFCLPPFCFYAISSSSSSLKHGANG